MGLSFLEAVDAGVFYLERPGGIGVGPVQLYPIQRDFFREVFDTYVDGIRRYRQAAYCVPKKFGKSASASLAGAWHLLFDETERNREIYSLAGDHDQALITMKGGQKIIKNSPRFASLIDKKLIRLLDRETVFLSGDGQEHRWRAMASDSPTAHGLNPSLVLMDEGWQLATYDLLEAVSMGPQRRHPLQLWTTYAGLQASMVDGNPLYDLYKRGLDGTDAKLYFLWLSGLAAYDVLPRGFIRDGYLEEQARLLPRNRYLRMHMNEWGSADATFLTEEEIARATDATFLVPERAEGPCVLVCDYGRSHDHTAIIVARPSPNGRTEVVNALALKGTRANPVPLEVVEEQIMDWTRRYGVERIHVDPFQMLGTAERLSARLVRPMLSSIEAEERPWQKAIVSQPIGPQYLNRLTMGMLGAFRSGMVRIPAALTELITQLGAVVAKETFYGVRVDSGVGVGVRAHDDLVISLGIALIDVERRKGERPVGAAFAHVGWLM